MPAMDQCIPDAFRSSRLLRIANDLSFVSYKFIYL